jgi:DNA polymerase-3 subunit delta
MKIRAQQLPNQLENQPLAAVYLLLGDEPLLHDEAYRCLIKTAKNQGFIEKQRLDVDDSFAWSLFQQASQGLSLFARQRLLDLRLQGKNLKPQGAKLLQAYAEQPMTGLVLLISAPQLDKNKHRPWLQTMAQRAVVVESLPINRQSLPAWIGQRLQRQGVQTEASVVDYLAQHNEGNLLALAQEIKQLSAVYGKQFISLAQVQAISHDNAKADVFAWVDALLAGDDGFVRLQRLKQQGTAILLINSVLGTSLRTLYQIVFARQQGQALNTVFQQQRVWPQRQTLFTHAMQRHTRDHCLRLLVQNIQVEKSIKSNDLSLAWLQLQQLALAIIHPRGHDV